MPPKEKLPAAGGRRLPPMDRDGRARSARRLERRGDGLGLGSGRGPRLVVVAAARADRPSRRSPPAMAGWCRTPIDRSSWPSWRRRACSRRPEADRRTLIRRLSFDLLGLPPTPEEIAAFLDDRSPDAYERLVDRLLASPHYGERWARHWMDVVHFAETHGHDQDRIRPNAWPYRDYLIASFNRDTPYARFVAGAGGRRCAVPRRAAAGRSRWG